MRNILTAALAVALAACGSQSADEAAPANEAVALEENVAEAAPEPIPAEPGPADPAPADPGEDADPEPAQPAPEDPATPPVPDEAEDQPGETANATIPAALRGRWALVPADCTSTRGDAKGLMTVNRDNLRFYESRATLGRVVARNRSRIVADFAFMGEGQEWQRRIILDGQDGGRTLIRREQGADAMPGPLRYTKCAA